MDGGLAFKEMPNKRNHTSYNLMQSYVFLYQTGYPLKILFHFFVYPLSQMLTKITTFSVYLF